MRAVAKKRSSCRSVASSRPRFILVAGDEMDMRMRMRMRMRQPIQPSRGAPRGIRRFHPVLYLKRRILAKMVNPLTKRCVLQFFTRGGSVAHDLSRCDLLITTNSRETADNARHVLGKANDARMFKDVYSMVLRLGGRHKDTLLPHTVPVRITHRNFDNVRPNAPNLFIRWARSQQNTCAFAMERRPSRVIRCPAVPFAAGN